MKGKYYEEESIIRRKVLWVGKCCEKERIIKRRYHQKESIITTKVLWEGNHYELESIIEEQLFWEREDIIMRKFVGHFYEKESIFKSFHQFG